MIFRGTYDYSLDAKNRLTVPAKFRASLSDGVILAQGIERCIDLWPPAAFERHVQTVLSEMHPLSVEFEKFNRFYSANSLRHRAGLRGPGDGAQADARARRAAEGGRWSRAPRRASRSGTAPRGREYNGALHRDVGEITGSFGHAA